MRAGANTENHKYIANGEKRQTHTSDPQIPAALTPVVAGIVYLHNFPSRSLRQVVGQFTQSRATGEITPLFTTTSGCGTGQAQPSYALGPADSAKIYNIPASSDGTGGYNATSGFADISVTDVSDFRAMF